MSAEENPIWRTLADDQENISWSRRLLEEAGLIALFEAVPTLFAGIAREVEAASHEDLLSLFARPLPDGSMCPPKISSEYPLSR